MSKRTIKRLKVVLSANFALVTLYWEIVQEVLVQITWEYNKYVCSKPKPYIIRS